MKKTLSFVLVAVLLLCMIPAFGIFADAEDLSIDSADELLALVKAANEGGDNWQAGKTYTVSTDIDMSGKTWVPFNKIKFAIDFGGHTLSNVKLTVKDASGNVGLLANNLSNGKGGNGTIYNLTLKDCSLTVNANGACNVGLVGDADRGNVTKINIDGLTIKHTGGGYVGTLMGLKRWGTGREADIIATMKNVTIDAEYAQVGIVIGQITNESFNLTSLDAEITVKACVNEIENDTYTAAGANSLNVTADAVKATVVDKMDGKHPNYAEKFATIDSAKEFAEFTKLINMGVYSASGTVKVTKDLDMEGVKFSPINRLTFILDFDGHTVSNLVVNTKGSGGKAGLISCESNNHVAVMNAKFYNCELNVEGCDDVGIVMGKADRATATNITIENVTVNAPAAKWIGGVIGDRPWDTNLTKEMTATLKNVVFNVDAATHVGVLIGRTGGDSKVTVTGVTAENITVNTKTEGFDTAAIGVVGQDGSNGVTTAEGATVKVEITTTATGYEAPEAPETPDVPETGDMMVVALLLSVVALAGVAFVSKKRVAC